MTCNNRWFVLDEKVGWKRWKKSGGGRDGSKVGERNEKNVVEVRKVVEKKKKGKKKSPWRDLNSRPLVYKTSALTTELQRQALQ